MATRDTGKEAEAVARLNFYMLIGAILAVGTALITIGTGWNPIASLGFGVAAFGLTMLVWATMVTLYPTDKPDIDAARREERKLCWEEINAHIKEGSLPAIPHAERNGMVMACNIIFPKGGFRR